MADATETDRRRDEPCEDDQPPSKKLKTETGSPEKQVAAADSKEGEPSEDKDDGGHSSGETSNTADDPDDLYVLLGQTREKDVGITEYISSHQGIGAIFKQSISDIIVNEISKTGEVVHLTNTDSPVVTEESTPDAPMDSILPEDFWTRLKLVAGGSIPGLTASILVDNDPKKQMHIHRVVQSAFHNLTTKSEKKGGRKVITAMLKERSTDQRRCQWPPSLSEVPYCRFVMFKKNISTMEMIHIIARSLKLKDSVFSYAGTTDGRCKTTQEVTAYRVHHERLNDLNRYLHITLGNFRYVDKHLKLGELTGNRFTIVLRNVIGEDEDIDSGLNTLKSVGFINYYRLQKIMSFNVNTIKIGRALLREEWEEAVNLLILGDGCANFRQVWRETRDVWKTFKALGHRIGKERWMLKCLQKRAKDFLGALNAVPRNTRLLYMHSFQSLVWNCMVSRRIKTFGLQPVVGDLVLPPDAVKEAASADIDMADAAKIVMDLDLKSPKVTPIVLDDSNLSQFSIYDVVLPLPGHSVIYPQNSVHTWYKEFMEQQGLDIDNMQRKQKDFSLPGSYRTIVVRPSDMEWKMFRYNDPFVPLALSDRDRLQGREEPQSVPDGKLRALRVSFNLPSSSYATIALRELLKTE